MSNIHEECGVFGVYANESYDIASTVYYGLYALQHRGQESCGIVVNDDDDQHDRIKIDMNQHPRRFNELMRQQAPFVRVNGGHGRINSSGLRILRHHSLDRLAHNDLPEALQLHFANGDPIDAPGDAGGRIT